MKRFAGVRLVALALVLLATSSLPSLIWADNGPNHQVLQTRPIQLGTSGGNINDRSRAFCCSGTLGALVQNGGRQFILSNNHVLARTNQAELGEDVIQPGLIDLGCFQNTQDAVADLSAFKRISFKAGTTNTIDAAIAQVRSGAVDPGGSILDVGQVNSSIVPPALGVGVKKSGRTTGLTRGMIRAVNVTVDVFYSKRCGVGSQKARFVNQIAIGPEGFSAGGDSGALVVEDVAACSRPVGLLFAGSSTITLANPISDVLSAFGVGVVGCTSALGEGKGLFRTIVAWLFPPASAAQRPPVDPAAIANAAHAKERHEQTLLSIPGVVGAGVGLSDVIPGQVVIEIYVERDTAEVRRALPAQLDGVPVRIVETGPIVAYGTNCAKSPCGKCSE